MANLRRAAVVAGRQGVWVWQAGSAVVPLMPVVVCSQPSKAARSTRITRIKARITRKESDGAARKASILREAPCDLFRVIRALIPLLSGVFRTNFA
jgi:hypothetical protein